MAHSSPSPTCTHGNAAAAQAKMPASAPDQDALNAGTQPGTTISIPEALK